VECHPLLPQKELLAYCKSKGILVEAYSPLGSAGSPLLGDPALKAVADKHHASVSQILISWQRIGLYLARLKLVSRGAIVLPKSVTPSRIKENFTVVELSREDIVVLEEFSDMNGGPRRFVNPPWGRDTGFADRFGANKISDTRK
jgi:glycerol 2-dehydrogenase (NADP+)